MGLEAQGEHAAHRFLCGRKSDGEFAAAEDNPVRESCHCGAGGQNDFAGGLVTSGGLNRFEDALMAVAFAGDERFRLQALEPGGQRTGIDHVDIAKAGSAEHGQKPGSGGAAEAEDTFDVFAAYGVVGRQGEQFGLDFADVVLPGGSEAGARRRGPAQPFAEHARLDGVDEVRQAPRGREALGAEIFDGAEGLGGANAGTDAGSFEAPAEFGEPGEGVLFLAALVACLPGAAEAGPGEEADFEVLAAAIERVPVAVEDLFLGSGAKEPAVEEDVFSDLEMFFGVVAAVGGEDEELSGAADSTPGGIDFGGAGEVGIVEEGFQVGLRVEDNAGDGGIGMESVTHRRFDSLCSIPPKNDIRLIIGVPQLSKGSLLQWSKIAR